MVDGCPAPATLWAMDELLARACATLTQYKAYGNEVLEEDSASFVRNAELPTIYDANHGARIRAESPKEIEALLARSEEVFANFAHRRWFCDPLTPPAFEATLVSALATSRPSMAKHDGQQSATSCLNGPLKEV